MKCSTVALHARIRARPKKMRHKWARVPLHGTMYTYSEFEHMREFRSPVAHTDAAPTTSIVITLYRA
jgi:hypothetical protein